MHWLVSLMVVPQVTYTLFTFLQSFFFLFLRLSNFNFLIFKFSDSFFSSNLLLNPFSDFLISFIIFSSSGISVWFLFTNYLFIDILTLLIHSFSDFFSYFLMFSFSSLSMSKYLVSILQIISR